MELDHVTQLLRLRWQLTDQRFNDDTVTAWHEMLIDVSSNDATAAMRRLIRDGHSSVNLPQLFTALGKPRHHDPGPRPKCDVCDGTGMSVWRIDARGYERYGPCPQCRPTAPQHRQTTLTDEEMYPPELYPALYQDRT
jgi:hypothetical protein